MIGVEVGVDVGAVSAGVTGTMVTGLGVPGTDVLVAGGCWMTVTGGVVVGRGLALTGIRWTMTGGELGAWGAGATLMDLGLGATGTITIGAAGGAGWTVTGFAVARVGVRGRAWGAGCEAAARGATGTPRVSMGGAATVGASASGAVMVGVVFGWLEVAPTFAVLMAESVAEDRSVVGLRKISGTPSRSAAA